MAAVDLLTTKPPQSVHLFPTTSGAIPAGSDLVQRQQEEALFFQYWPQSLVDDYQVEYAEHQVPGGSHPLYQWVGGRGRVISFQAIFTSELNTSGLGRVNASGFIPSSTAGAVAVASNLTPSNPFTVDVSAALNRLRAWLRPRYQSGGRLGVVSPPPKLTLVFPGTSLNGTSDLITVILRSAPVTIESWFPDGQPRVATVDLTFNEIVQSSSGQGDTTSVEFIGRDNFAEAGRGYRFRGLPDRPFVGA